MRRGCRGPHPEAGGITERGVETGRERGEGNDHETGRRRENGGGEIVVLVLLREEAKEGEPTETIEEEAKKGNEVSKGDEIPGRGGEVPAKEERNAEM